MDAGGAGRKLHRVRARGERLQMIAVNKERLGAPGLVIVPGEAPDTFAGQSAPDAIFIGGGAGDAELFAACWRALKPGGRLVANAVTLEGETGLIAAQRQHGGHLTRIDIADMDRVGRLHAMRPRMSVLQLLVVKGTHA